MQAGIGEHRRRWRTAPAGRSPARNRGTCTSARSSASASPHPGAPATTSGNGGSSRHDGIAPGESGSCAARPSRRTARTDPGGACAARTRCAIGGGHRVRRRRPTGRDGSDRHRIRDRRARRSSPDSGRGQVGGAGSARARHSSPAPRGRVNRSGAWTKATSWTVTTWAAFVAAGIAIVEWQTSTAPVARSTAGHPNRFHDSYSHGRAIGSWRTAIGGVNAGSGRRRWRPATPISSMSARSATSRRATSERGDRRPARNLVPALLERVGDAQRFGHRHIMPSTPRSTTPAAIGRSRGRRRPARRSSRGR